MSRKHKPKLGQNFLSDLHARQRIVDALGDVSGATVLEIGPGHGALTELLATRAKRLVAIELDRALVPELRFRFRNNSNVEIVEGDVLKADLPGLVAVSPAGRPASADPVPAVDGVAAVPSPHPADPLNTRDTPDAQEAAASPDGSKEDGPGRAAVTGGKVPAHVVGNLPYYITSDILLQLFRASLAAPGAILSAVLMMQREVAERVASPPGRRDFGLLSATAQMHARAEILFTLGPESFSPPPEVDSSVLRLRFAPRFAELGVQPAGFDRFLHQAFAQKRKTLAKNLRQAGFAPDRLTRAWPAGLGLQVRAEASSLEDLAALYRGLEAP